MLKKPKKKEHNYNNKWNIMIDKNKMPMQQYYNYNKVK